MWTLENYFSFLLISQTRRQPRRRRHQRRNRSGRRRRRRGIFTEARPVRSQKGQSSFFVFLLLLLPSFLCLYFPPFSSARSSLLEVSF